MLLKVIPTFEKMFNDMGHAQLPAPTQVVIDISHAFMQPLVPASSARSSALVVGFDRRMRRTEGGREIFDRMLLRVPVIGPVLRKIVVARFTRTLGTLLVVRRADPRRARHLREDRRQPRRAGRHPARARARSPKVTTWPARSPRRKVFPTMVVQMIGVGEQTGAMDQMLQKIADFYEEEVDTAVAGLTSLIEPVMMAFLGVVVGGLIIAMYLPIFKLAGNIQEHERRVGGARATADASPGDSLPRRRRRRDLRAARRAPAAAAHARRHGRARPVAVAARCAARAPARAAVWLQSAIIAATYLASIVFGVLLRARALARRASRGRCSRTTSC